MRRTPNPAFNDETARWRDTPMSGRARLAFIALMALGLAYVFHQHGLVGAAVYAAVGIAASGWRVRHDSVLRSRSSRP